MHDFKTLHRAALIALLLLPGLPAGAVGPSASFDTELRQAYGGYRQALYAAGTGDQAGTVEGIHNFAAGWAVLMTDWRSARPPQYADDAGWGDTLAKVAGAIDAAKTAAMAGQLPQAHKTLEGIRDALWALHVRNGIISFSDRVSAYHAALEKVLQLDSALYAGTVAPQVAEAAGVLDYLASDIEAHPAPEAKEPDYATLLLAFRASVTEFVDAVNAGDAARVKAAIAGLKPAYAKFFLKYG